LSHTNESQSSGQRERRSGFGLSAGGGVSPLESLLQRIMIIGEICVFRDMLLAALNKNLKQRTPFLMNSLSSLIESTIDEMQKIVSINISAFALYKGFIPIHKCKSNT
jgi:hypothetical protein